LKNEERRTKCIKKVEYNNIKSVGAYLWFYDQIDLSGCCHCKIMRL